MDSNALETLVPCLEEFDPTVKEAASWAIGYIAQHTPGTATYHLYPVILTMALIDVGARVICACNCRDMWWGSVTADETDDEGGESSSFKGYLG